MEKENKTEVKPQETAYNGVIPVYHLYTRTDVNADYKFQAVCLTIHEAIHLAFKFIPEPTEETAHLAEDYFFIHTTFRI